MPRARLQRQQRTRPSRALRKIKNGTLVLSFLRAVEEAQALVAVKIF